MVEGDGTTGAGRGQAAAPIALHGRVRWDPGMPMRRVRARVTGRVQGVSYRASAQGKALELGLTGWVRNRGDGSVELEIQGPSSRLEVLVAWCRRGPPAAWVSGVEVQELELAQGELTFLVQATAR